MANSDKKITTNTATLALRQPVVLAPGAGRTYAMGKIAAVFKADGDESANAYSISEWWLDPKSTGPGAHAHPEDDIFYVLEGTMSFLVNTEWKHLVKGAFILIPAGTTHDFENRGTVRAGALNISVPGGFEPAMPEISDWFAANPPSEPLGEIEL
jgi:mannose-6-phosphate isomerase-like protein (cupin superfamily)